MSITDLKTKYVLYTVAQVAEIFPAVSGQKAHVAAVRELVEEIGCYRKFGDEILLTEGDVRSLLDGIAARGPDPAEPLDSEIGHLVVIGPRVHHSDALYFIGWSRTGGVQSLVHTVQRHATERVDFLDAAPCTYGEHKQHLSAISNYRHRGYWHVAVPQLRAYLRQLFDVNLNPATFDEEENSNG